MIHSSWYMMSKMQKRYIGICNDGATGNGFLRNVKILKIISQNKMYIGKAFAHIKKLRKNAKKLQKYLTNHICICILLVWLILKIKKIRRTQNEYYN